MAPRVRTRMLIVGFGAVALVVGGITFYRARASDATGDAEYDAQVQAHRRTISEAHMRPVQEPLDELFQHASVTGPAVLSEQQLSLLVRAASDFIAIRASEPPMEDFVAWRLNRGYVRRPIDELRRLFPDLDDVYARLSGNPGGDVEWDDAWRVFWQRAQRVSGRAAVPIGMADSPQTMGIAAGWISHVDSMWPQLPKLPGYALQFYDNSFTSHPWWVGPTTVAGEIQRRGRALVAVVGCVVEFGDGARRPLVLSFVWDAKRSSWWLETISYGGDRPLAVVY